jgi:hypothetical protein
MKLLLREPFVAVKSKKQPESCFLLVFKQWGLMPFADHIDGVLRNFDH